MLYKPYADITYYHEIFQGSALSEDDASKYLRQASRHIDTLTYNRIVGQGFYNLTEFQQDIIREVCCRQAEFECENVDILDTVLNSYSVNGVSMGFNGQAWNVFADKGVAMKKADYSLLAQTGLTCRLAVR